MWHHPGRTLQTFLPAEASVSLGSEKLDIWLSSKKIYRRGSVSNKPQQGIIVGTAEPLPCQQQANNK